MAKHISKAKSTENRLRNRAKRIKRNTRKNATATKKEWRVENLATTLAKRREAARPLNKKKVLNLLGL